jgi:hypothetical protein
MEPACIARLYIGVPGQVDPDALRDTLEDLVRTSFRGATILETRGLWQGESEDGYMAEVIMSPVRDSCTKLFRRAERLASEIAFAFEQETVLLLTIDANGAVRQGLVQAAA